MPHSIKDNRQRNDDAMDEFESLFGESNTGYGSFLPDEGTELVVSKEEKEKDSQKPPLVWLINSIFLYYEYRYLAKKV